MEITTKFVSDLVSSAIWPISIITLMLVFKKNMRNLINSISNLKFGNFEINVTRKLRNAKIESVKNLTINELRFFLCIAAQSWKVKKIDWTLSKEHNIEFHKQLETNGLYKIKSIDNDNVDGELTKNGIELYDAIIQVLFESIGND